MITHNTIITSLIALLEYFCDCSIRVYLSFCILLLSVPVQDLRDLRPQTDPEWDH